jgi:hypothetical protein
MPSQGSPLARGGKGVACYEQIAPSEMLATGSTATTTIHVQYCQQETRKARHYITFTSLFLVVQAQYRARARGYIITI